MKHNKKIVERKTRNLAFVAIVRFLERLASRHFVCSICIPIALNLTGVESATTFSEDGGKNFVLLNRNFLSVSRRPGNVRGPTVTVFLAHPRMSSISAILLGWVTTFLPPSLSQIFAPTLSISLSLILMPLG